MTLFFGGNELVPVSVDASTGSGEYCLKIESDFTKFYYNPGSGWTALLKDGTKHYFGLMSSSRVDNTHGVFRWYLCKAEDSNGNFTVYDYEKDAQYGAVYPLKISYTYNDATEACNRVEFIREGRTDLIPSYTTHTEVITAERLKYIKTYANDQLANQYILHYDYGENSGRSRLIRVQLLGTDGTTALPATVFEYTQGGNGMVGNQNNISLNGKNLKSKAFGDFDSDGFNDVVLSGVNWQDDSDGIWVLFSKGDGTFTDPVRIDDYGSGKYSLYPLAGDVNGDGKCDIVLIWIDWDETEEWWEVRPKYVVFLAQEWRTFKALATQSFTMQGTPIVRDLDGCGNIFLGDINGDGLSDLLYSDISEYCTYISDGSGMFEEHYYDLGTTTPYGKEIAFTDVTGDGRSDLVRLHPDVIIISPRFGSTQARSIVDSAIQRIHRLSIGKYLVVVSTNNSLAIPIIIQTLLTSMATDLMISFITDTIATKLISILQKEMAFLMSHIHPLCQEHICHHRFPVMSTVTVMMTY